MIHRAGSFAALRTLLGIAAMAAASAAAAAYPDRPITMVVPHAAGGANDVVARLFAEDLSARLGQSVVVENRPGAGGNIGTASVARADADGYTLLMTVSSSQAINPLLYASANFDPVKDFVPVGTVGSVPNVLLVNQQVKAPTLQAFIEEARLQPGKYRYGSAGNGTLPHLMAAMLASQAQLDLEHIPYRGIAAALNDLLGGQIQMAFSTVPAALPQVRAGSLRALGVTSAERVPSLPDVPAIGEVLPGYQGVLWIALYAPAGTPQGVVDALDAALAEARRDEAMRKRLADIGVDPLDEGPEQLAQRLQDEMAQWRTVLDKAQVRVD